MAAGLWSAVNLFTALNLTHNLLSLKVRAEKTVYGCRKRCDKRLVGAL